MTDVLMTVQEAAEYFRISERKIREWIEKRDFPAGTLVVRTAQPLGNLAAYLLEPESDDGLIVWNAFDRALVSQWGRGPGSCPVFKLYGAGALVTETDVRR